MEIFQKRCPACDQTSLKTILKSKDFFLTKQPFTVDQCDSCGLKFTNPRPELSLLEDYYNSRDYISHREDQKNVISRIYYLVREISIWSKLHLIRKFKKSGKILDIGCGTGEFLKAASINYQEAIGIEPYAEARKICLSKGLNVLNENELTSLVEKYDVITMWHVLEHVYNLKEKLSELGKLIKKDGILVVAVPNPDSWDAKHYGEYWAAWDLPRHLYHFNQKSIQQLFENFGFQLISSKPMIFDSFYISMISEKFKTGKVRFFRGLAFGFVSNFIARLNQKNFSSLIYIFKLKKA